MFRTTRSAMNRTRSSSLWRTGCRRLCTRRAILFGSFVLSVGLAACSSKTAAPVAATPGSSATPTPPARSASTAPATASRSEAPSAAAFDGCDTCHVDVADEVGKTRHQAKKISCVKCHGASREHARDENNEVKPDRVFARGDIDTFCSTCHKCSRPRGGASAAAAGKTPICTDCHGSHAIVRAGKPGKTSTGAGRG